MGSHANYYWIIHHLVELKHEFHRVRNKRFHSLMMELNEYEIIPHSDDNHLPNNRELAQKLHVSQSALNAQLRDLLLALTKEFYFRPLAVPKYVHHIYIALPFDEQQGMSREKRDKLMNHSTYIQMILPVTPSIGDEIHIPFIEQLGKHYHGYVHNIKHTIWGQRQEILVEVHPFKNYYFKWLKMKDMM